MSNDQTGARPDGHGADQPAAAIAPALPPLSFACPACGGRLDQTAEPWRCSPCDARYPVVAGVPQFVSGDGYWGEIPADDMLTLVADLEHRHWHEALANHGSATVRQKTSFIADHRRANWTYDLPLDSSSRVLDLGCGMGSVSAALAPQLGEVVALESVGLRVEFCRHRFTQDGLDNIRLVRADGLRPPFPPASFSAIVLNGVLEWLAHGQGGKPRAVQLRALERLRTLLRPDGYLVVAIENRTGLGSFRGRIDHNYMKYTALFPRWLADLVTRARRGHPYDTYTYTHRGFLKLFRDAGFDNIRTRLPIWGYNRPDFLVPLGPQVGREMTRLLEMSRLRAARWPQLRRLERRLRLSPALAEDFLFLARQGPETRTSWLRRFLQRSWDEWQLPGDGRQLEFLVLNRAVPSILVFAGGAERPQVVVKLTPSPPAGIFSTPGGEIEALRQVVALLPAERQLEVPRPLTFCRMAGHDVAVTTFLAGRSVMLPAGDPEAPATLQAVARLAAAGLGWLGDFAAAAGAATSTLQLEELQAFCRGGGRHLGAAGEEMEAAGMELMRRRWPAAGLRIQRSPQHGDFALSNLIDLDGRLGVIDWERYGRIGLPGFDAIHFVSYMAMVAVTTRGWEPHAAMAACLGPSRLGAVLRPPLGAALETIGFDPGELPALLTAYILAYAREYGPDPGRRGMMRVVARQLAAVLELADNGRPES